MPIQKKRMSPRQKMINLMYLVLMAMLALNVSSDVLNGFSLVLMNTYTKARIFHLDIKVNRHLIGWLVPLV